MAQEGEKTGGRGAGDAEDDVDDRQAVGRAADATINVLEQGDGVEAGEDEKEADAEDENVSQPWSQHCGRSRLREACCM